MIGAGAKEKGDHLLVLGPEVFAGWVSPPGLQVTGFAAKRGTPAAKEMRSSRGGTCRRVGAGPCGHLFRDGTHGRR